MKIDLTDLVQNPDESPADFHKRTVESVREMTEQLKEVRSLVVDLRKRLAEREEEK